MLFTSLSWNWHCYKRKKKIIDFFCQTLKIDIFQQRVHGGDPCMCTKFGVLNVHLHFNCLANQLSWRVGFIFPNLKYLIVEVFKTIPQSSYVGRMQQAAAGSTAQGDAVSQSLQAGRSQRRLQQYPSTGCRRQQPCKATSWGFASCYRNVAGKTLPVTAQGRN